MSREQGDESRCCTKESAQGERTMCLTRKDCSDEEGAAESLPEAAAELAESGSATHKDRHAINAHEPDSLFSPVPSVRARCVSAGPDVSLRIPSLRSGI